MPEGDAVRRTARRLAKALDGTVLTRSDFRVPRHATADLAGATVVETVSRGKHLLTRVDAAGGPLTLHTHLKMDGSWRVFEAGKPWNRQSPEIRVVLETEGATAVGYLLGIVELVPCEREPEVVGHLGPDLLGPAWDEDEALRRLRTVPDRPVFEALRDQTLLAGIGTIYAAEVLFVMGVPPTAPVREVPDLVRMVRRAGQMLDQEWSRSSRMWVYRQRLCRRCGTRVATTAFGAPGRERTAYWCPSCQPAPP
ncbi:DNA-formamidopyrimidine glycosylase family protein [Nocardioides sp. YIM 152315]|uniref:DNA-formamidopyrimidine glycosylase family protein n=1 Tax=Nocardioides sp. YIM 152315 TaxID=3031760 RepID=UPI0023DCAE69|nr:DNA-formamidopyrimidine glycosylase family protein [Nocardioides sp. YIM 152315]MDF1605517.1 Fpg/Nei family DNA glycosylase [Nocardioides sp. YIM 152315]